MESAFKTDVGQLRSHNEDNGGIFVNVGGELLAVVADGMGGHQAGDVASKMTSTLLSSKWEETKDITTPTSAENWLIQAIKNVNAQLYDHANIHPECRGMGTTLVSAICTKQFVTIAHIGDSRGYILNEEGFFRKTEDHSLVNELVKNGQISVQEAENHPRKNVLLRALGTEEEIQLDIETIEWEVGNYLLLCSDGLSNKVTDDEMESVLLRDISIDEKVEQLVALANERGGEDNITLALVHYTLSGEKGEEHDRKKG